MHEKTVILLNFAWMLNWFSVELDFAKSLYGLLFGTYGVGSLLVNKAEEKEKWPIGGRYILYYGTSFWLYYSFEFCKGRFLTYCTSYTLFFELGLHVMLLWAWDTFTYVRYVNFVSTGFYALSGWWSVDLYRVVRYLLGSYQTYAWMLGNKTVSFL